MPRYTQDIQTGKNCLIMCVGVGVAGNVTGLLLYSMESEAYKKSDLFQKFELESSMINSLLHGKLT